MNRSLLSTILLTLTIILMITATSTISSNKAYAIENYLQLRSANVNHHGGDIDIDIRTGDSIPSEKGNSGYGYAMLTDVGNEFVNNVLVAITDIGIENYDESKNDKLYTYVLDLTGDISRACSGSDYEVARSSSDNGAFDTNYPIDVKGNKISIDDVDKDDLASDTVKAVASFTTEAITRNDKIQHVCIDTQDVLKQSEISLSYDNNNGHRDDDNDDHDNKSRHKDKDNDKNRRGHDDDNKKDDNDDSKDKDEDNGSGIDIDQDIDQSNECDDEADCSNEAKNEANLFGHSSASDDEEEEEEESDSSSDRDIGQSTEQSNECDDEADCSNEAKNEANIWEDSSSDIDIGQSIEQSNECEDEADCSNEAKNE